MAGSWEHFAHDSDIGVRGRGATVAEAFAAAGVALTAVITGPDGVALERGAVDDVAVDERDVPAQQLGGAARHPVGEVVADDEVQVLALSLDVQGDAALDLAIAVLAGAPQ